VSVPWPGLGESQESDLLAAGCRARSHRSEARAPSANWRLSAALLGGSRRAGRQGRNTGQAPPARPERGTLAGCEREHKRERRRTAPVFQATRSGTCRSPDDPSAGARGERPSMANWSPSRRPAPGSSRGRRATPL
jgi:hypothetical protein